MGSIGIPYHFNRLSSDNICRHASDSQLHWISVLPPTRDIAPHKSPIYSQHGGIYRNFRNAILKA